METGVETDTPIRCRRARREDFAAVREILLANGASAPGFERTHLRRFRRIVADLGDDLYVAEAAGRVVGFVHVSFTRQIAEAGAARIEALLVSPEWWKRGVPVCLIEVAGARARRRGFAELGWLSPPSAEVRELLARQGWRSGGETVRVDLGQG